MTTSPAATTAASGSTSTPDHRITTPEQLQALLGECTPAATLKELDYVHPIYEQVLAQSPFFAIASSGPAGLDVSPRGDPAGFMQLADRKTLLLPERRGNNRADTLRNILSDPRVGLLFLIPGIGETLRINGLAQISKAPDLLARFLVGGKPPTCVLVVTVQTVFFQCARAMARSQLWAPRPSNEPRRVPTAGEILGAVTHDAFDGAAYDQGLAARQAATMY